jgi:hypothetical protein
MNTAFVEIDLGFVDRVGSVVKYRCSENSVGLSLIEGFIKVLERSASAGSNHGNGDGS